MRLILLTFLLTLLSIPTFGQYVIKGKVVGKDDNLPLPQVAVFITGTNKGVPTNMDGEFTLEVSDKSITITIRYVGYITKTISPDFTESMLIKLRPDCTHHHYHSTAIKIYGGLDLTNNALAGRIELPMFSFYKAITSSYEISGLRGQVVHRADAKIWDLTHSCSWDLSFATSYRNYRITTSGFKFNSVMFSPQIGFDKTDWILGVGRGVELQNDAKSSTIGVQIGLIREFRIRLREWVFIPVRITATKWNSFWDIESSVDLSFLPLRLRVSYNRIDRFNQFSLTAGVRIHP